MREELNKLAKAMRDMSDMVGDLHWMAAKAVEDLTKKDARIVELEADLTGTQSRVLSLQNQWRKQDAELAAIKAQGVVMPERKHYHDYLSLYDKGEAIGHNNALAEVARLNATPVQQVSVPDGWTVERGYSPNGYVLHSPSGSMIRVCDSGMGGIETAFAMFLKAMLAAAPAAPAADAGIVDMYRHLQKVTPYRFKKIQDASITDGGDVMYFHKDRFDAALLADMAALSAGK